MGERPKLRRVPLVSVIIPTLIANKDLLKDCLDSLFYNNMTASYTVNIGVNRGNFGEACNSLALNGYAKYFLFLNDDIIFVRAPNFLERIVKYADEHQYNIVGCRLLNPDQSWHHVGVWFDKNANPSIRYTSLTGTNYPKKEPHAVIGACMLVEFNTFFMLGAFDPQFKNGFEDIDLCLKCRQMRGRIGIYGEKDDIIIHYEHTTLKHIKNREEQIKENYKLFRKKWPIEKVKELLGI